MLEHQFLFMESSSLSGVILHITLNFDYHEFSADELQLLFPYQVRDTPIGSFPISKSCRSEIDSGIQYFIEGPEVFDLRVPYQVCDPTEYDFNFDPVKLHYDEVRFSKTFYEK